MKNQIDLNDNVKRTGISSRAGDRGIVVEMRPISPAGAVFPEYEYCVLWLRDRDGNDLKSKRKRWHKRYHIELQGE